VDCRIMLPEGATFGRAFVDGREVSANTTKTKEAAYAEFSFSNPASAGDGTDQWDRGVTNHIVVELK